MSSRIQLLHAYHDGELGPLRRWQVRRWLARDPSARRELDALAAVGEAVRDAHVASAAPDVWADIEGRLRGIDAERQAGSPPARAGAGFGPLLRPAAAGAVLAAVAVAAALFLAPLDLGGTRQQGVVRWLDTRGQTVMVLDEGDATIIWLMQPDVDQVGRQGGWLGLI